MKQIFTFFIGLLFVINGTFAETTNYTMVKDDYQAIVDSVNAWGLNTLTSYTTTNENYYGASAYYSNFDAEEDGSWNMTAFATWTDAVNDAVTKIVLPKNFAAASVNDTFEIKYKYYKGSSVSDSTQYVCTSPAPSLLFEAINYGPEVYSMESNDYQIIVDYVKASPDSNKVNSYGTAEYYFGASAYYSNFDIVADGSFDTTTFASWEEAVPTAIGDVLLPTIDTLAEINDVIRVEFAAYNGASTEDDYFDFKCTSTDPLTFELIKNKAKLYSFELAEQIADATIDYDGLTVSIEVEAGTDITSLVPTIETSEGATSSYTAGTAVDFSTPFTFTVTSADSSTTKEWTADVTVNSGEITSIYDIQYVSDPTTNDSSTYVGQTVTVAGIVTAFVENSYCNKYYIQNGTGSWNGIYVYDSNTEARLSVGDSVVCTGSVSEYYGLTELVPTSINVVSTNNTVPEAVEINSALTEESEGILVTLKNATISADTTSDNKAYLIATVDGNNYKLFDELFEDVSYTEGSKYDITGAVTYTYNNYRICPRSASDISSVAPDEITSIYDIQYVSDPATNDSSTYVGQTVTVTGIITAFSEASYYNKYYIQNGTGSWNGIYVYDRITSTTLSVGDSVVCSGSISEYYGLTELVATSINVVSSSNTVPEAVEINSALTEESEGILVTLKNATISADTTSDNKAYLIATVDGNNYKLFDELFDDVSYTEGSKYDITGAVTYTYSNYRICPRSASDISVVTAIDDLETNNSLSVYPNPVNGSTISVKGTNAATVVIYNSVGQMVKMAELNGNSVDIGGIGAGVYFLKAENSIVKFIKK